MKKNKFIRLSMYCMVFSTICRTYAQNDNPADRIARHHYPKLFVQIQDYLPDVETLNRASKWDILILDAELVPNCPEFLGLNGIIRNVNPDAVILSYFSAADVIPGNTAVINSGFMSALNDDWYMKDIFGSHYHLFQFENGSWSEMLNLTTPVNQYLPDYLSDGILSTTLTDGIFYDWITEEIHWLNTRDPNPNAHLDIDNDHLTDSDDKLDSLWVTGTKAMLHFSRDFFPPDMLIAANGGSIFDNTFQNVLNGRMVEDFLGGEACCGFGWHQVLRGHYLMHMVSVQPRISMIMANGQEDDYAFMRFSLTSVLLLDGYLCFTNPGSYQSTRWYDEYAVDTVTGKARCSLNCKGYLGKPLWVAHQVGNTSAVLQDLLLSENATSCEIVWRRDFDHGAVFCNPTSDTVVVIREDVVGDRNTDNIYRISGQQDAFVNNGQQVTGGLKIPPHDGIILLIDCGPGYNDPPQFVSSDLDTAYRGIYYQYTARACDPEDSTVTYQFMDYPAWLAPADSVIAGTPPSNAQDTCFSVIASDRELQDTLLVHVRMMNPSGFPDFKRLPAKYHLNQNYPNPFNPSTTIVYHVKQPCKVELSIYNVAGQIVKEPVHSYHQAGEYAVRVNMQDMPSGIYFCRICMDDFQAVKKMMKIE